MKIKFITILLLLVAITGYSQQISYVYIESDQSLPFYVKYNGKMMPRYGKNYSILSKMPTGPATVEILFEQNSYSPVKFNFYIPDGAERTFLLSRKDQRFMLYDLANKTVLLENNSIEEDRFNENKKEELVLPVIAAETPNAIPQPQKELDLPESKIESENVLKPKVVKVKTAKLVREKQPQKERVKKVRKDISVNSQESTEVEVVRQPAKQAPIRSSDSEQDSKNQKSHKKSTSKKESIKVDSNKKNEKLFKSKSKKDTTEQTNEPQFLDGIELHVPNKPSGQSLPSFFIESENDLFVLGNIEDSTILKRKKNKREKVKTTEMVLPELEEALADGVPDSTMPKVNWHYLTTEEIVQQKCEISLSNQEFENKLARLGTLTKEKDILKELQDTYQHCWTFKMVEAMAQFINSESAKYYYLNKIYPNVVNPKQYYTLESQFFTESYKMTFLNKYQQTK